jgi:hypothetical protein
MSDFVMIAQEMTIEYAPVIDFVALHGEGGNVTIALEQKFGKYGESARVLADYNLYLSPSAVRALHKALTVAINNEGTHTHWMMNDDLEMEQLV